MTTHKPQNIRHAVLIVSFLLLIGSLSGIYIMRRSIAGPASAGIGQRIAETPIFSFLPRWFLNREAIPISRERNTDIIKSVLEVFDPSLKSFLTSVPIILDSSANTAKAYQAKGYIGVSPDWDHTVGQSRYRTLYEQRGMKPEDPVFPPRFKTVLLIHEFLHILQVHQGIDSLLCYETIARWYLDPRYGVPSPNGVAASGMKDGKPDILSLNRIKYEVWHELYNYQRLNAAPLDGGWKTMRYGPRYRSADRGVEEFAYVGQAILANGSGSGHYGKTGQWSDDDWKGKQRSMREVSPEVIALYRGVFNPALMSRDTSL